MPIYFVKENLFIFIFEKNEQKVNNLKNEKKKIK
jgi:hypothetical protein